MAASRKPALSARKQPKQDRSSRLVADVLEAAIRILERDGAQRFTMARVAEKAGVSVGSLYQYFPNKESILFRLQTEEWAQTGALLEGILGDTAMPPPARLKKAVKAFFRSECEEARLRVALEDAAPLYRDAAETRSHHRQSSRSMEAFMREILPEATPKERAFAADILKTTMSSVGKRISEESRTQADIDAFADAIGEMLCGWLEHGRETENGVILKSLRHSGGLR